MDEVVRWVLRLRPCCVVAAFDVPLGHLALDDARRRARTTVGVEPTEQSAEEGEPAGTFTGVPVRGEKRPGGRWSVG